MRAPYLIRVYRSGVLVGRGWCWERDYAYEQFSFNIRRPGVTAVRLIEMQTGEILAAWETAPASSGKLLCHRIEQGGTGINREAGGLGDLPHKRQPEGGSRAL